MFPNMKDMGGVGVGVELRKDETSYYWSPNR